jgi:hypothetical protein
VTRTLLIPIHISLRHLRNRSLVQVEGDECGRCCYARRFNAQENCSPRSANDAADGFHHRHRDAPHCGDVSLKDGVISGFSNGRLVAKTRR